MGISREEALDCFRSDDLVGIGMEADAVRRRLHPEGVVSYVVEAKVDCGPVLTSGEVDVAALDKMCGMVTEAIGEGATGLRLLGAGARPRHFRGGETIVRELRRRFASLWIEGFGTAEIASIEASGGLRVSDVIVRLLDAGLDTISSDSPLPSNVSRVEEWIDICRAAHGLGMRTAAAMVFGAGETLEQRVDFLEAVRRLQEETGGFTAFVPVAAAGPGGRELDAATAVERLKTLAISRMFLDNIENVQSSRAGQGLKVLQTGLRFGANDVGTVDADTGASEEDLRRVIRDAGFRPVQRDALHRTMFLN
jgi:cyclic dehypoxanthinyl futalosine synthase